MNDSPRKLIALASLSLLLALALRAPSQQPPPAPKDLGLSDSWMNSATAPATTSAPAPLEHKIEVHTLTQFVQACRIAAKQPNTTIELDPAKPYIINAPIEISGLGTKIHGNGALLKQTFHFTGTGPGGFALIVQSTVGPEVPFNNQTGGLWACPRGFVTQLNHAAGGGDQEFFEYAPCQDAAGVPLFDYKIFRPYVTQGRNITISDLEIRVEDPQADSAFFIHYAHDVTIENVTVTGGNAVEIVGSDRALVKNCRLTGVYINSCTFARVTQCELKEVMIEEMARWCDVDNNRLGRARTNDIMCEGIRFLNNRFVGMQPNFGSIAIPAGTRITMIGNHCDDQIWVGGNNVSRYCLLQNNISPAYVDYTRSATKKTTNITENNHFKTEQ